VVLEAPTPELVEQATNKLAAALAAHPERFRAVSRPGSGSFFEQNGLLYLSSDAVRQVTDGLMRADPVIGTLAGDPSLRGALDALSLALLGVERGDIQWDSLVRPMTMAAATVEAVLTRRPASFSWQVLASSRPPEADDTPLSAGRARARLQRARARTRRDRRDRAHRVRPQASERRSSAIAPDRNRANG
jgi:hypothetical protein